MVPTAGSRSRIVEEIKLVVVASLWGDREFQLRSTEVLMQENGDSNLFRLDRGSSERLHEAVKVVAPVEQPLSSFSCERPGRNRPASHAGMTGFPPAGGSKQEFHRMWINNGFPPAGGPNGISSSSGSNGIPPDGGPKQTGNSTERRIKLNHHGGGPNGILSQVDKSTGITIPSPSPEEILKKVAWYRLQGGRRRSSAEP